MKVMYWADTFCSLDIEPYYDFESYGGFHGQGGRCLEHSVELKSQD